MQQGVRALPQLAVYGSEELHLSDHQALRTLGLGSGCVHQIPIDERYAMRVDLLVEASAATAPPASSRRSSSHKQGR
ncbi:MAG: hypothetical protein QOH74_1655 [Gaiellales bacterium]|jgi:glutamate/tyrosine decarboxylase-like PLP-dependent enzyme|nr:hypothetical protein [Gaiellales bacterium]